MKPQFSLKSLGCARSLVDSEHMLDQLNQIGFEMVPEGSSESIRILNTCSFIQAAIDETEANINQLISEKKAGTLKHIVVAGCYPSRYKRHELEAKYPEVDLWFSTKEEHLLQTKLSELVFKKTFQPNIDRTYLKLTPNHYSYLKISEGCNNWCSFCTIPKIRGVHTSKPIETVLEEAKFQLAMGAKELILIAEDTTCWGEDIYGKASFPLLLNELSKLPVDWIRVMYVFPARVDDDFIATIKHTPNIINYIDMPIQHVNSDLLEAMNRKHDKEFLEGIVKDMYAEIPDLALRTTFITGFPGETDEMVDEVCEFMTTYPFAQLGCFTYSKERETRSAKMQHPVSLPDAQKRLDKIMRTQYDILSQTMPLHLNKSYSCIYEGNKICRAYFNAPEVDSYIILDSEPSVAEGQFCDVKLTDISGYDFLGTQIG